MQKAYYEETADEALSGRVAALREWSSPHANLTKPTNQITANNVLKSELGEFADRDALPTYRLDQGTRDRLLAHGREDAAHILLYVISLTDEIHQLKSALKTLNQSLNRTVWALLALFL